MTNRYTFIQIIALYGHGSARHFFNVNCMYLQSLNSRGQILVYYTSLQTSKRGYMLPNVST